MQSFTVIFKRNTVKTLSVLTLVVELCEAGEDSVLLTASVMSSGLPQPELSPEDEYATLL